MSLFSKIQTSVNIPSQFPQRAHPLPPPDNPGSQPVQTNKFYGNMLLDDRNLYIYPQPYSLWWTGNGVNGFCGLAVSHHDAQDRVMGPDASANPVEYFFMPTGVMSLCLSARWGGAPSFSTDSWGPLSLVAQLDQGSARIRFPIANGMGFVTGVYSGVAPVVSSQVGFRSVTGATTTRPGVTRVNAILENGRLWSIYISSPSGGSVTVTQNDPQHITVNSTESNLVVQVARLGDASWQAVIDSAAGSYPTQVTLDGGVTKDYSVASYAFNYNLAGSSTGGGTLLYAAPHHVESFTSTMNGKVTSYYLQAPVLSKLRLCVSTVLEMFERLPRDVGFLPWSMQKPVGDQNFAFSNFSGADIELLVNSAQNETSGFDMGQATDLSSMYWSGKVMDKFAMALIAVAYVAKETDLAKQILARLKTAFATFVNNKQQTPLFYDQSWKGLVSQAGINDPMADYGNTYYNDHHFHYGYFIHAAAVIAKVDTDLGDGSWVKTTQNVDFVNMLVRDVATYGDDLTFPQSRSFDWYQGHSLAKGLFASADGKDEESSSEDYHCYYGMKLWGEMIGDAAMTARANLILAVERRAMGHYMLYLDNNTTVPSQFVANKVAGITFENKCDHTTYFGTNLEYIQGIQMIPTTPISSFIRSPLFVQQEWEEKLAAIIDNVDSGWKGLLQVNRALYDPKPAYSFFSQPNFPAKWLDAGQSLAWSLAFTKALT